MYKIISLITAISFLVNSTAIAAPVTSPQAVPADLQNIFIPEQYGRIVKPEVISQKSQVILIKDAHCNYEAQKNIARILDILIKDYKIDLIGVEGASGEVDPSAIANSPDTKRRNEVSDKYIKKGWLTASEALAMERGKDYGFSIFGVENLKLYLNNLKIFREVFRENKEAERFIQICSSLTNNLKPKLYPASALLFDRKVQEYESNTISLTEFIQYLNSKKPVTRNEKNLNLALRAIILEKTIDFAKIEKERTELIKQCEKVMPKEEIQQLVQKSLFYKLGRISSLEYYTYLNKHISAHNPQSVINLKRYIKNLKIHSKIDENKLFNEIDSLIEDIYKKELTSELSKQLYWTDKSIYFLNKLLRLELTRDGLIKYRQEGKKPEDIAVFLKVQAGVNSINIPYELNDTGFMEKVNSFYRQPEEFYKYALERDKAIIGNLIHKMKEAGKNKAALVVGGFHAEGINQILREQGIQVITITPSITKEDPESKEVYLARMMDEGVDPDEMMKESGINNLGAPVITGFQEKYKNIIDAIQHDIKVELQEALTKAENPEEFAASVREAIEKVKNGPVDESARLTIKILNNLLQELSPETAEPKPAQPHTESRPVPASVGKGTIGADFLRYLHHLLLNIIISSSILSPLPKHASAQDAGIKTEYRDHSAFRELIEDEIEPPPDALYRNRENFLYYVESAMQGNKFCLNSMDNPRRKFGMEIAIQRLLGKLVMSYDERAVNAVIFLAERGSGRALFLLGKLIFSARYEDLAADPKKYNMITRAFSSIESIAGNNTGLSAEAAAILGKAEHPDLMKIRANQSFRELGQKYAPSVLDSIAISVYRLLYQYRLEISGENIKRAIDLIIKKREEFVKETIFGPGMNVINIAGEQLKTTKLRIEYYGRETVLDEEGKRPGDFDTDVMEAIETFAGVDRDSITSIQFNNQEGKSKVFKAIENADPGKPLLIYYSGHMLKDRFAIGEDIDIMSHEFAEALIRYADKGGNLNNVIIIYDGCFSLNFHEYVSNYIRQRGYKFPNIPRIAVTTSEFNKPTTISIFQGNLLRIARQKQGRPITGADIIAIDEATSHIIGVSIIVSIDPQEAMEVFGITGEQEPAQIHIRYGTMPYFPEDAIQIGRLTTPPLQKSETQFLGAGGNLFIMFIMLFTGRRYDDYLKPDGGTDWKLIWADLKKLFAKRQPQITKTAGHANPSAQADTSTESRDSKIDYDTEIIRELKNRFGIDINADLNAELAQKIYDLLRALMLDEEITDEELQIIIVKTKETVETFRTYKDRGIEQLNEIQEIVAIRWIIEALEKNKVPGFVNGLIKALGGDENLVRPLITELYKYEGYDDYFIHMVSGVKNIFNKPEAEKHFEALIKYVQVKSRFKAKGNVFVQNGDEIIKTLTEFGRLRGRREDAQSLLSKIADITAGYLVSSVEILNLFKDDAVKKQVKEGIESIIRRKQLDKLSGIKPGRDIQWQANRPLIVDAEYLLTAKKDGTYMIDPAAGHLKALLLKAGGKLNILYKGNEQGKSIIINWLGIKDAPQFISTTDKTPDGAVILLTSDTADKTQLQGRYRVIRGREDGNNDYIFMSQLAGILGNESDNTIKEPLINLYKEYFRDSNRDNEINTLVDHIIASILSGRLVVIDLPPIVPYAKAYYDALRIMREAFASAA